ncbi:MAG: hypothetical protein R3C56_29870 [Pirellulaceae bacterium]
MLSADVEEANVNKLLTQMIETISNLTAKGASETSSDSIRAALTKVLEENGVDVEQFEQALPDKLGSNGSFVNQWLRPFPLINFVAKLEERFVSTKNRCVAGHGGPLVG